MDILLLEDDRPDAELVTRIVGKEFPGAVIHHADSQARFQDLLTGARFDLVLSDGSIPGCEGVGAFHLARERAPSVPFVFISGFDDPGRDLPGLKGLGVTDVIPKSDFNRLAGAIREALDARAAAARTDASILEGYERLVTVVKELSLARDLPTIMTIVRRAARQLTGADGATFVLRDGNQCYYADEDAIGPLWKGQRFPMETCLSGWSMTNRQPAVVPDIFADPRIPISAYEPTFVRSVVMVPIRAMQPIGAIGTYWATRRIPDPRVVRLVQALADTTAVAMENVRVYQELEERVRERTAELEAFSYAVSHDLRAPVRHVTAFSSILAEDQADKLDDDGKRMLARISNASTQMSQMIEGLLGLSRMSRAPLERKDLDLAALGREVAEECQLNAPRKAAFTAPETLTVSADPTLMRLVLQNLLGNAWKFSGKRENPAVELGVKVDPGPGGETVYFVRDNGAGFNPAHAAKLFNVFQRLHLESEFTGTGIGLATVQRIIRRHDGRVWADGRLGEGATFYFTIGPSPAP